MNAFVFSIPTLLHFGAGSSKQAGSLLKGLLPGEGRGPAGAVLVVADPQLRSMPWMGEILSSLQEAGLEHTLFSEIKPNPRDEDVLQAAALLNAKPHAGVLAIGGGSTIDTAKAAALVAAHGGAVGDYAGWGKVPGDILPLAAIPTTAGSGSEATSWAVITDTRSHVKLAIGDRHLAPAVAILDPALTVGLPASLTAATGMDVLTHAIEAYLCPLSSPLNDTLALEAIRLVAENLPTAFSRGMDLDSRSGMMLASTLGGIAINNADVAGVHCLTEGMGSLYDAPHGLLNAIFLPHFMAFWRPGCPERFARIAQAMGTAPDPDEAVRRVESFARSFQFPALPDLGVKRADLPRLAGIAATNVSNPSNPVPMSPADYLSILEKALESG